MFQSYTLTLWTNCFVLFLIYIAVKSFSTALCSRHKTPKFRIRRRSSSKTMARSASVIARTCSWFSQDRRPLPALYRLPFFLFSVWWKVYALKKLWLRLGCPFLRALFAPVTCVCEPNRSHCSCHLGTSWFFRGSPTAVCPPSAFSLSRFLFVVERADKVEMLSRIVFAQRFHCRFETVIGGSGAVFNQSYRFDEHLTMLGFISHTFIDFYCVSWAHVDAKVYFQFSLFVNLNGDWRHMYYWNVRIFPCETWGLRTGRNNMRNFKVSFSMFQRHWNVR